MSRVSEWPIEHHSNYRSGVGGSILARIDSVAVSEQAKRESRNREKHLPPLTTFRWWARRTGAVNAAVLDAARGVFEDRRLNVLDPFAGGGTIPLVALRAGHNVHAQDLNPWAAAGIRQMLTLPSAAALDDGFQRLKDFAEPMLSSAYTGYSGGSREIVLHTYRVAVGRCGKCDVEHRQFPYALLTLLYRKERLRPEAVLACSAGHVFFGVSDSTQVCPVCERSVDPSKIYLPRRAVTCPECGWEERLSERAARSGWRWEVCLLEKVIRGQRRFVLPTLDDHDQAERGWVPSSSFGPIPRGSETAVLLRHGFANWEDLYPARQRVVTESLLDLSVKASDDQAVVEALQTAIIGTTEFAGHLSRWDRFYLKCNDATAGHRFNFSTFVPELNVWGVDLVGRGTVERRVHAMMKASEWFRATVGRTVIRSLDEGWDAAGLPNAQVVSGDSAVLQGVPDESIDLILTDPPYHDDVHYGELSLPFRAWAGLPMGLLEGEASTNVRAGVNVDRDSYSFSLSRIFLECRRVMRTNGRLVFSYANHEPKAWLALIAALQDSGFYAISCVSLHSENETDFKKRNVQSCTEDLMMELAVSDPGQRGVVLGPIAQDPFMGPVASLFTQVGNLKDGWMNDAALVLGSRR